MEKMENNKNIMKKLTKKEFIELYNKWSGRNLKSMKELEDAYHEGDWNVIPSDFMSFVNFVLAKKIKEDKKPEFPVETRRTLSSGDGEGEWRGTDNNGWTSY
jgi:hypothetical protein